MSGKPFQRSGRGREAFPEVRVRLGGLPRVPGVVGRQSRRSGRGWEAH